MKVEIKMELSEEYVNHESDTGKSAANALAALRRLTLEAKRKIEALGWEKVDIEELLGE